MNRVTKRLPFSLCALLLCVNAGVLAQTPPTIQHAEKQAASTAKSLVKTAKHVARKGAKVARKTARVAGKEAKYLAQTPAWPTLKAAYDYDSAAPPDVKEEPVANEAALQINLTFTGPYGKEVDGIFMRPKADGVYPCVLLPHGLTNNKETAIKMFGNTLVKKGLAVLALDAPEHGKQRQPNKNMWTEAVITVAVHEGGRNYRRVLDYLANRQDVDNQRIGLIGYSLGSITGAILGAVDDRIKAFAFCVGGDPFRPIAQATQNAKTREAIFDVSPSLFIGHISPRPIIMYNGNHDIVIVPPAAVLLQQAAQQPRQVVWYNGGHDVPQTIESKAIAWMVAKLGTGEKPTETKPSEDKPAGDKPADTPPTDKPAPEPKPNGR